MRHGDSIFWAYLQTLSRWWFEGVVADTVGDAYDKNFRSWGHLELLPYVQLGSIDSLRRLERSIGYSHIDISEVRPEEGNFYLFVATRLYVEVRLNASDEIHFTIPRD